MRVLLVEDEVDLAQSLAAGLSADGFTVEVAHDGAAGLAAVAAGQPEVLILDRDLPVISGDAVCQALVAAGSPTRILMLTAASSLDDRVNGLDLGADDYLAKPFAYVELVARIRALGRRAAAGEEPVLERGDLRLDSARRVVERAGRPVRLTPTQFAVLEVLLLANGGYVSVDELLEVVWDGRQDRDRSVVKMAVHGLRNRLGSPPLIETGPRHGYRIS
ncbi:response regulator transcription factor [Cellulomonas denverensis]|uniref:Response regulator transcription factor n=1 Tax=Cellulomonas denverensis TaxID=264297 RepID=A0A7X6KWG6_9CELL|nr:response regulator transcription factor [Cellulomonas denverensis]NKY23532.1 response regulator transcription factor [Cellulomonas denverensis]GIG24984.1 transcriptional regulatory protein CutR [Cellulomonas denverensis]